MTIFSLYMSWLNSFDVQIHYFSPMKATAFFFVGLTLVLFSCKSQKRSAEQASEKKIDTLETASGLRYYYVKKGDGQEVEPGSTVGAFLNLRVKDKVVWTTASAPDSLFTFTAGRTRLIKGFTEMALLLREGDEVVAIMPPSIAYGSKGMAGFVPPNATIVYAPFRIVKVTPATDK